MRLEPIKWWLLSFAEWNMSFAKGKYAGGNVHATSLSANSRVKMCPTAGTDLVSKAVRGA